MLTTIANRRTLDLRSEPRTTTRGLPHGYRLWTEITGITLHQTAAVIGPDHHGIVNVPAHAMVFADGTIGLLNDPTFIVCHGNAFNSHDIGIEISCHAAGIEGDLRTFWKPKGADVVPVEATDAQLRAARDLVRYYVDTVAKFGGKLTYIHAHRQSSRKPADPGSRIWQGVGVWAQTELGLQAGPWGWHLQGGLPIPTAWDPRINRIEYSTRVKGW